ncbi:urate hydroxylase PuuD [Roseinatronobacter alkalisoli]|uniref:Urate hydroxylase PuuD n=1 Tax=Roseinatronobacter alkalisoli TaxID=3028235 RepID=A0ABT5T4E8_9RHOB|nr:urate hydroxylase PuuD [Roseinatronobacter sp. HJB301]MDD7969874.1 urate hydroxylase PuuD [Roseinatronobacter sp. HJB301]
MLELAVIGAWAEFALRWLHVITAIAWIGSSFYFIALDLGLRKSPDLPPGAYGEEWQVHGGGFYHVQKYLVAPAHLPEHLIWFKWESYATWLSGFALMALIYYVGAEFYLIDADMLDLAVWQAIAISIASLGLGWVIYDALCKSRFGDDNNRLMVLLFVLLVIMAWGYTQVFTGRAALLHLGAFTATIMSANVFMIIIPNQKIVVADLRAGRTPDAKYGRIAKQRSTHNNYLTLPVIFLMLSNHYPLAFASDYNWLIAGLVFLMGVTIRHFFNTMHMGGGYKWWTWAATTVLFIAIIWLSTLGQPRDEDDALASLSPTAARFVEDPHFEDVYWTVVGHCSMCHAQDPVWPGLHWAPKGIILETEAQVARAAQVIYLQSGVSHAMPPGSTVLMDNTARAQIADWYRRVSGS